MVVRHSVATATIGLPVRKPSPGRVDDGAVDVRDARIGTGQQRWNSQQHQRDGRRQQAQAPQQDAEQQDAEGRQCAQGVDATDHQGRTATGVPDVHAHRNGDECAAQHRDAGVFEMFQHSHAQPRRTAPVRRGEDVSQGLLQEIHAGAFARIHGVASRPAARITMSTTTASTKIAMMPAMIWSLLSA